jgi:hypothetical protein
MMVEYEFEEFGSLHGLILAPYRNFSGGTVAYYVEKYLIYRLRILISCMLFFIFFLSTA